MQHHQHGAGSPYRAPTTDMVPFSPPPASGPVSVSSMPPPMQPQPPAGTSLEELPADGSAAVNFHYDDMLVDVGCGGSVSVSEAGGPSNRWPREETLALIRIRSEMDAAFRNAGLRAPVWEEVSRKLAELGYHRSAKKCKEKFENVDKYYKRTKEGRAGRQDGKSYRFFSELEALHAAAPQQHQATAMATAAYTATTKDPQPLVMARMAPAVLAHRGASLPDLSFSSNSESESDDESDDEEEEGLGKLTSADGGSNKRMMALFEGMMKQVTEKQDAMQRLFLETLDKWEAERTAREETWRRKEVARINREREELAKERTAAASRDAALIAFLQRVGGQSVQLPPSSTVAIPKPMPAHTPPLPHHDAAAASLQLVPVQAKVEEGWAGGESSGGTSRWPKEEVQALIQLRMEKDEQYKDMGPKGPLWEDISAGMRRIGYSRSAKRCKEKWENINKYFKKVKESNKRRPEGSKTCPYFHQLDAIYRKKHFTGSGGGSSAASGASIAAVTASEQENPQRELEGKSSNDFDKRNISGGENVQAPLGTGQTATATTMLDDSATNKKAEDIVTTKPKVQSQQQELDETDSDDMEGNYSDEGDDDGNEDDKMQYKIEFQKPKESGSGSAPTPATTAAVTSSAPTSSTFLAVQ